MSSVLTSPLTQPGPMQAGEFTSAGAASVVSWSMKRLAPPSPLYVTVDDVLRVSAATSQAGEVVTVSYRLLRAADGKIVLGQFTVTPAATRAVTVKDNPLSEGFLLSASCQAAVATTRGQTFVRLLLNPKALGAGQPGMMLMSDYVTTQMAPGYPNGRVLSPIEGPGAFRSVVVPNPLAGTDWSTTVPSNARWRACSLSSALQTSAAAGNRFVNLITLTGGNASYVGPATQVQPASTLSVYSGSTFSPAVTPGLANINASLPAETVMLANDRLLSFTTGLLAADQWSNIYVCIEEWLDNV